MLDNNISRQGVLVFSQFQNSLLVGCHCACWWAPFRTFSGHKRGPSSAICYQYLSRTADWAADWPSASGFTCFWPVICIASILYTRQHSALPRPAFFVSYSKILGARIRHRCHKWELGADVMGQKGWDLLSWHWSVNSVRDERFGHSQLGALFLILASLEKPR